METQVVKFDITESAISEMKNRYMGLVITDLEDKEQYDTVHDAHMIVRGKRIAVEKRATDLNAEALAWQKAVHSRKNSLVDLIKPIESHLKDEKQKAKDEKQRKEDAQIAAIKERIAGFSVPYNDLKGKGTVEQLKAIILELYAIPIEPDEFFGFTAEANRIHSNLIETIKQALSDRELFDYEQAEQEKAAERLAVERKKQEEIAAKQKAEQAKIDAEKREIAEEKTRIEREKFERKAKEKAKAAALGEAERIQHNQMEQAKIEAAEQARQEALRPDKDQIYDYANDLMNLRQKPVDSKEAIAVMKWAKNQIIEISECIKMKADDL